MEYTDLNFTKEDFDFLIAALSPIAQKKQLPIEMLLDATKGLKNIFPPELKRDIDEKGKEAFERENKKITARREAAIELQAKLIKLRRLMEQNNGVLTAQQIIDAGLKK